MVKQREMRIEPIAIGENALAAGRSARRSFRHRAAP
jgi:hypothetical protein